MTHSFTSESTYYTQKPWKAESEPAELRVQGVQVHPQILLGIEAKAVLSIDLLLLHGPSDFQTIRRHCEYSKSIIN